MKQVNYYFNPLKMFFMLLFIIIVTPGCQSPPRHVYSNGFVYQLITHNQKLFVSYSSKSTSATIGSTSDNRTDIFNRLILGEKDQSDYKVIIYEQEKITVEESYGTGYKNCLSRKPLSSTVIKQSGRNELLGQVITVKDPEDKNVYYRVIKQNRVERSLDGGKSWNTIWSKHLGRHEFVSRYRYNVMCLGPSEPGPYDLSFTPDGSMLIVTMGTEGILAMTKDGIWKKYVVSSAKPTPHYTFDFFIIFSKLLKKELLILFLILLVASLFLHSMVFQHSIGLMITKDFQDDKLDSIKTKELKRLNVYYYIFIFSILMPVIFLLSRELHLLADEPYNLFEIIFFLLYFLLLGIWLVILIIEIILSIKNRRSERRVRNLPNALMMFGVLFHPLVFFLPVFLMKIIQGFNSPYYKDIINHYTEYIWILTFAVLTFLVNRHIWSKMLQVLDQQQIGMKLKNLAALFSVGTFFIPLTVLVLWTFGMIPWYELSLFLAISGVLFLWFKIARKTNEMGLTLWKE